MTGAPMESGESRQRPRLAWDLPGAESESGASLLVAPDIRSSPLRVGLCVSPQAGGWCILIPAPFRALPPVSWRVCLALVFWSVLEGAKGNSGGGASWEHGVGGGVGGLGERFSAGGRWAGPSPITAFRTHALDAGMATELRRKCWQDNRAEGGRNAMDPGTGDRALFRRGDDRAGAREGGTATLAGRVTSRSSFPRL